MRSGHTEAAVDLCRLAGLEPVGVISELVNDDGTVMRGPPVDGIRRARTGSTSVSVADIIAYRQRTRKAGRAHRRAPRWRPRPGRRRLITYVAPWDPMQHVAVVFGDIRDGATCPFASTSSMSSTTSSARAARSTPYRGVGAERTRRRHLSARGSGRRRRHGERAARRLPPDREEHHVGRSRAETNGAKSASARRSCAISASSSIRPLRLARTPLCRPGRLRHRDRGHRASSAADRLPTAAARSASGPAPG